MPDGDVIRRGVRFAWRPAYEGLCDGGNDADVHGLVSKGLTASLRARGIPGLGDGAALVQEVWSGRISAAEAMGKVATTIGSVGGTRDSAVLDAAVRRVIAGGPTGARPVQAVAEAVCHTLVDAELMAKLKPALLERPTFRPSDVEQVVSRLNEAAEEPIRQIAQQLVADPTGARLRSPPAPRRRRKNTSEMLKESAL